MKKIFRSATLSVLLVLLYSQAYAKSGFTDGQAIGYIVSSNQGQIELSQIAKSRSTNYDVKEFAAHMIKVHEDRTVEFKAMEKKLGLQSTTSPDTKDLEITLAKDKDELTKASDRVIEMLFLRQEINHHKKVISEITGKMLPSIKKAEIKTTLTAMLPRIQQNLEKAESILKKLDAAFGG